MTAPRAVRRGRPGVLRTGAILFASGTIVVSLLTAAAAPASASTTTRGPRQTASVGGAQAASQFPQCNGGGTYPVPVIGNTCQAYPPPIPTQYQTAVTAFEATAVDEVLQTHGVAPSNWAADQNEVLSWGRNEVRAQEWLDLVKIMQEPATSRGTNDTLVYQWFQGVYQSELVTQAQDAVNEYNKWSDNPCTYQPPGGLSLDGAYTYAGNQPEWCTQPCTNLFAGCFDTPPSVNDFVEWGQYETLNSDISDEVPVAQDSKGETLYDAPMVDAEQHTSGVLGVAATLAANGATTPLASEFASQAAALNLDPTSLLSWTQQLSGLSPLNIADLTALSAELVTESASVITAAVGIFSTALEVVAPALTILDWILVGVEYVLKIKEDSSVQPDLQAALASAQSTAPDLSKALGSQSSYLSLFVTFLDQTMPDVNYASTCAPTNPQSLNRQQPCAQATSIPPATSADPHFLVRDVSSSTQYSQSSIYTFDPVSGSFVQSRATADGWFVSTKYDPETQGNKVSGAGSDQPSGAPGPSFQSYEFNYVDGLGRPMTAQLVPDAFGNPEFAYAPLTPDTNNNYSCSKDAGCVTHTIIAQAPDGSQEVITIAPPAAQINVSPAVPTAATLGTPFTLSALASPGNSQSVGPYTYTWTVEGTQYTGSSVSITLPDVAGATVGSINVGLTVTDSRSNQVTSSYTMAVVAPTDAVVSSSVPNPVFGQPGTYWVHLLSVCTGLTAGTNQLCGPGPGDPLGSVQWSVNGRYFRTEGIFAAGVSGPCPPAPAACSGFWSQETSIPPYLLTTNSGQPNVVTATYAGSAGLQPALGNLNVAVAQSASSLQVQAVLPGGTVFPLGANPGPSYGQPLTFTAKVLSASGPWYEPGATGNVQFVVDGTNLGSPVPVVNGVATSPSINGLSATKTITSGHDVQAYYTGDVNDGGTSACLTTNAGCVLPIAPAATTVTVSPPTYPVQGDFNAPVTLSATATPQATGFSASVEGSMSFLVNGSYVGSAPVQSNGSASISAVLPPSGPSTSYPAGDSISATLADQQDSNFSTSQSPVITVLPTAPTVTSATAPPLLAGSPFSVTFSRPVAGITTSDFTVNEVGSNTGIAATIACADGSGNPVSCATGAVSQATLTPTSPLIAGEYYFVLVNQAAGGVVGDPDGVALPVSQTYVRAQTGFTAFQYPLTYAWATFKDPAALGGSYVIAGGQGASETFTMKGRSLGIVTFNGPDGGTATVSATNGSTVVTQSVDTYAAATGDGTTPITGLSSGQHTVTITVDGGHDPSSTGDWVRIDGLVEGTTTTTTPRFSATTWPSNPGVDTYDNATGSTVSLTFRGTGVSWTALTGPADGKAKVTVDGVTVATTELYKAKAGRQTLTFGGLSPDGFHTMKITALGEGPPSHPYSTDIDVVSLQVQPTVTAVQFAGSPTNPTVTIEGDNFGTQAALGAGTQPCGSPVDTTGKNYGANLWLADTTAGWAAGDSAPPVCNQLGLKIISFSPTQIVFTPGSTYPIYGSLNTGDSVTLHVLGAAFTTTVSYT